LLVELSSEPPRDVEMTTITTTVATTSANTAKILATGPGW
jgi:hypothetical protein